MPVNSNANTNSKSIRNKDINVSVIQENNNISINVGSIKKVKGIAKVKLLETEKANAYNMVAFKDEKIITNSYYDETTNKMVFKLDGNGDYQIDERSHSFNDTQDNWANDIISYNVQQL